MKEKILKKPTSPARWGNSLGIGLSTIIRKKNAVTRQDMGTTVNKYRDLVDSYGAGVLKRGTFDLGKLVAKRLTTDLNALRKIRSTCGFEEVEWTKERKRADYRLNSLPTDRAINLCHLDRGVKIAGHGIEENL